MANDSRAPMPRDSRSSERGFRATPLAHLVRYGGVVAAVTVAAVARWLLNGLLGVEAVFVTFYPTVAVTALLGGWGPGALATGLSAAVASIWFIHTDNLGEGTAVGLFVAGGLIVGGTAEALRRQRASRLDTIEQEVATRTAKLRLMAAVVEHARDAVIVTEAEPIDEPGPRIVYVNPAFLRETGYTTEEVIGRSPRFLQGPGSDRAALDSIRAALKRWKPCRVEVLNYKKDGTPFWAELDIAPLADSTGWFTHWIAIQRDVTERRRAEATLRESEQRWRDLAEALPQLVWTCAPDGRCDFLSRQWVEYTGLPEIEQLGHGWLDRVHPDDRDRLRAAWAEAVSAGTTFDVEFRIRRADGVYRWFKTRAVPVFGDGGRIARWFGSNTDVDDMRQLAEALREREARLGLFVEHAPVALAMFDRGMRYLHVSRRWREDYHLGDGELAGRSHYDVFPEITERWRAVHRRALAGEVVRAEEDRFDRPDGSAQWLRWEVRPWSAPGGEIGGILIFTEDITERKRADERLRESDVLLRAATDNAAVGLVLLDRRRRYVFANLTYCKILGLPWTASELVGHGPAEMLPEVYESQIAPRLDRAFAGERVSYELSRPRTGAISDPMAHYVVVYDPIRNGPGGVDRVIVTIFDITERKRAERALAVSEERLRLAQSAGGIGIYDWDVAAGESVWTEIQEAIYGLPPGTFEGGHGDWLRRVHPDDLARLSAELERCFRERRTESESEYRIIRGDGEVRCVANRGRTTYDPAGRPLRMVGTTIDVTERRQAESMLRERESRLSAILNTAADAVITIDGRGIIETANPAASRMFGYDREEMVGRNVAMLMLPPFRDEHDEYIARYLETGRARIIGIGREVVGLRKDGSTFPADLAVSEIDHLRLFTGILRDATRRKELEREVVEIASLQQRQIGQDLHDTVGQELTALNILAGDLTDAARAEPATAGLAERVAAGLRRCQRDLRVVIRGLLPVPIDTEGLMAALADLADRTRRDHAVDCTFDCPEPVAVADNVTATHLYLIAQEAVHNAVKHARPRSVRIALTARPELTLRVADDGVGMPAVPPESRGLGLRIMHNRAAVVGARLTVGPAAPHTGTVVTCVLPGGTHD